MLRTMDTEHFCEQIKVSVRQPHNTMNWRERDHINNALTDSAGGSRNSRERKADDKFPDNRDNASTLQRQPMLFITSSASHRLRILSSEQSHRKKLNISNNV
ncbi:hypothetical protein [Citrobacter sp. Res13-Sevr-PEB04-36]|uniref:hypothetical protein n=1 Tax=Citrobacter sp. Res13-Sevr-PEB04-36 TaxID=2777960 RepID=UPI0018ACB60C|nr:hypothetical protein [Citrobacter sp. Res13-Sevr-PEB04-36]